MTTPYAVAVIEAGMSLPGHPWNVPHRFNLKNIYDEDRQAIVDCLCASHPDWRCEDDPENPDRLYVWRAAQ